MTGGGNVVSSSVGTVTYKVTYGDELHCDATKLPNNLEINWGKGNNFHLDMLTSATCTIDPSIGGPNPPAAGFNTLTGTGTGKCNGVAASISFTLTDTGEPGSKDGASFNITGGCSLSVSGKLQGGNNQAHKD